MDDDGSLLGTPLYEIAPKFVIYDDQIKPNDILFTMLDKCYNMVASKRELRQEEQGFCHISVFASF